MEEPGKMMRNRKNVVNLRHLNVFNECVDEILTGPNEHVQFIHTKYMLVDPLSDDPSGAANFSEASTISNNGNMLVIDENKRIGDIYLGVNFSHFKSFAFPEWAPNNALINKEKYLSSSGREKNQETWHLKPNNSWWKRFLGNGDLSHHRQYFGG